MEIYIWNGDDVKNTSSISIIMISLLFSISCDLVVSEHSPEVTPELVDVGTSTVTVGWNSAGDEYYYSVLISIDSVADSSFQDPIKHI